MLTTFLDIVCLSGKGSLILSMKTTCLLSLAALLLFACESEPDEAINTLGSDISFSLSEYLEPGQQTLTFKFLTAQDYPCINYRIAHQVYKASQSIHIELTGVEKADVCLDAIGPATAFVDIGSLAEGDYALTIAIGESILNQGTLSVTPEAYELMVENPEGLILENTELLRIPDKLLWGTLRYQPGQAVKNAQSELLTALTSIGAAEKKLAEGNYFYFEVGGSGKIRSQTSNPGMAEDAFLMEFSGDSKQLKQVLQRMNQTFGEAVTIRMYNARGEEFSN